MWLLRGKGLYSASLVDLVVVVVVLGPLNYAFAGWPMYCWPKLWEGRKWTLQITQTDQGTDVWESTSVLSVDIIGNRLASQESGFRFGREYNISYLYYYPANTVFVVENGECEARFINGSVSQHCIEMPDEHIIEFLKEFLGAYEYEAFSTGIRGFKDGIDYFHNVDIFSVPYMEESHGLIEGVPTYTVSNYYNITLGIRDATVFIPPDKCLQTSLRVK